MERDKQLDLYRGLSMIYVVCFIHVIYWLKIGSEPLQSLMLFEMPLIFFISGASLSFNKGHRSLKKTIWSRIKRVVLPYYIYAVVMVAIVAVLSIVWHYWLPNIISLFGEKVATKYMFNISTYSWNDIWSILSFSGIPQSPCVWHLWFILPYLVLSCSFEIQKRILTKVNRGGYCLACIIVFFVIQYFSDNMLFRNIFCYNVFMVIGYCYYKQISKKMILLILSICIATMTLILSCTDMTFTPMQDHKFPPDYLFMVYNLIVLCLFSLLFSKVKIPEFKLIKLWNERGYTLYLYQSIVYFGMFGIYLAIISKIGNHILEGITCVILMFVMSTIASYIVYPLERWVMGKLFNT